MNPKRGDCRYPFKGFCAAGICYRFSQAIYEKLGKSWGELNNQLLPFAAIATICDLMELVNENRIIVKKGLQALLNTKNPGLIALLKESGIEPLSKGIGVYHIGYILWPCINASGRLEMAALAVELFLSEDIIKAEETARHLVELNNYRKEITNQGLVCAQAALKKEEIIKDKVIKDKIMVLYCAEIPESVAGIIAGRLKEQHFRPTIILSGNGNSNNNCNNSNSANTDIVRGYAALFPGIILPKP